MKLFKTLAAMAFLLVLGLGCNAQEDPKVQVLPPEEVKTRMAEEPDMVLVDVRTPEEFEEGHIEGARNINFYDDDFRQQMQQLDKDTPVYIYCRSGGRSAKAAKMLSEMGFNEIYDIEGGYLNWED